jgi:hypothetical protein
LEDADAEENMRCKRRGASSPMGFFFFGFLVAKFWTLGWEEGGVLQTVQRIFKGTQSPYFKEKQQKKVELAIFRALVVVHIRFFLYVAISIGEFAKKKILLCLLTLLAKFG